METLKAERATYQAMFQKVIEGSSRWFMEVQNGVLRVKTGASSFSDRHDYWNKSKLNPDPIED